MNRFITSTTVMLMAIATSSACRADNPLDLYVGGAIGPANVRIEDNDKGLYLSSFHQNYFGWKADVGIRPISLIGAEVDYIDFGRPSDNDNNAVRQQAGVLYGLLYVPIPVPLLDLYAKAGLAWLRSNASTEANNTAPVCQGAPCGPIPFTFSRSDADFAFGAGAQIRFSNLAVRAEYERIQGSSAKPDLVSLGLTWAF